MIDGILVVDVGTSKVHTNLVNISDGTLIVTKAAPYEWIHPAEGWSEVDPGSIWDGAEKCIREVVEEAKNKYTIKGLAFSYIGDSLLLVDENKNPLGNMILAFDSRAQEETREFIDQFGADEFTRITGSVIMPELVPFKLMWLRKHRPDLFRLAKGIWNIQQYMNHRLGLGDVTDYTLASRKILYNIHEQRWSDELCDFMHIKPEMLGSTVLTADSLAGSIDHFGSVQFGEEIPVILGAHDSESGMVGLGCIPGSDDVLANVTGTYDHIGYLVKEFPKQLEGFFGCWNGPLPDCFVLLGATISGPNLDWYVNTFFPGQGSKAINRLFGSYAFDGKNSTFLTKGVQTGDGQIRGINFLTTQENLFKAVIEGVTFPLKGVVDQLTAYNRRGFGRMRIGGGSAQSDNWSQLKADMFGIKVEKVANIEVSALGAAIMAAVALDYYSGYETAMKQMIGVQKVFEPRQEINERYQTQYLKFLAQE